MSAVASRGRRYAGRPIGTLSGLAMAFVPAATVLSCAPAAAERMAQLAVAPDLSAGSSFGQEDVPGAKQDVSEHDIVVQARRRYSPADPLARINAGSFAVAQQVDDAVVGPVALAYGRSVPTPVRDGLRNFLNNTREPVVFLSFLLELKPGKAGETAGRFLINSAMGIAGLFDVAKRRPFGLPRRPNGFGDVLGYHGVKPGPFLFLPLIGPTTLRDAIGGGLDRLVLPLAVGAPFNQLAYAAGTGAVSGLDRRVRFDEELHAIRSSGDPYGARRELFLQQRRNEIEGLHTRRLPRSATMPPDNAGTRPERAASEEEPGGRLDRLALATKTDAAGPGIATGADTMPEDTARRPDRP